MSKVSGVDASQSPVNEEKAKAMAKELAKVISPVQIDIKGSGKKKISDTGSSASSQKAAVSKETQKAVSKSLFTKIKDKMIMDKKSEEEKVFDLSLAESQKEKKRKSVV